ncbi:MAG: hypothetical protein HUU20_07875 [Pirellulales bacterium]|nr:hypothetical protein [Pirellulales bacterium]
MKSISQRCYLVAGLVCAVVLSVAMAVAANMPEAPKISTFAPAEELVGQLDDYVETIEDSVKSKEEFADSKEKIAKDADTVLLIALALGLHDKPNKYKRAAPGLVAAAKTVSAAGDYDAAKAAVEALKTARASNGDPSTLDWQEAKSASLEALMKQVPLINTKMKRHVRKIKSRTDEAAGHAALLAAIAQGSMPLADKTDKPAEAEKWYVYCAQMRDAASKLHGLIRKQDQEGANKAVKDLTKTCDDCHAVFHPEAEAEADEQ